MRFLHTADIHYGAAPDAAKPWGRERAREVSEGFAWIISMCREKSVDLLIISGGLFDGHPTEEWIKETDQAFGSIPDTRVVIIAGEDDFLFAGSPVLNYKWSDNVSYCIGRDFSEVQYDGLGVCITRASCDRGHFVKDRLEGVKAPSDKAAILVLSGRSLTEADIPEGFIYVALGGSHKPAVMRDGALVNSGAPEALGPEDTGKHGIYIGEIDTEEKKITSLKLVRRQTASYIALSVNVTPASTNEEVIGNIRRVIENKGKENIYRLRIKGKCDPNVVFDLSSLCNDFKIWEILDESEPEYDFVQLFRDHPSDMIGFFVKDMNVEDRSALKTKALNYGVAALLKTADERI